MKKGQTIRGYRLLTAPQTANGGKSEYAFAQKDGEQFFLKRFLKPKYPIDGAPGSPVTKQEARVRCAAFERRQQEVMDALKGKVGRGGNLVYPVDFFREGAQYYKAAEKIDASTMKPADLRGLSAKDKLILLRTVAHSVNILHDVGIVHGDLKPANILIKRSNTGAYVAKVIDFDDSYFEGREPESVDEIVGDWVYFSPELLRRVMQGDEGGSKIPLTRRSDVFALGIVFCEFWSGHRPDFQKAKYPYLCNAVVDGVHVAATGRALPAPVEGMIVSMLSDAPDARPSLKEVFAKLKDMKPDDLGTKWGVPSISLPRLKINFGKPTAPVPPPTAPVAPPAASGEVSPSGKIEASASSKLRGRGLRLDPKPLGAAAGPPASSSSLKGRGIRPKDKPSGS